MKLTRFFTIGLAALAAAITRAFSSDRGMIALANERHNTGNVTYTAEEAIATRYLVCKKGTDGAAEMLICDEDELPWAVCTDEPAVDEYANFAILGQAVGTLPMIASEAITVGDKIYVADDGKVQDEPTTAGTYYLIGEAVTAASGDGIQLEVAHHAPIKVVVVAALTSTNGTAAAASADLSALAAEAEKIGDDVRALGAALATPALVKVLSA